MSEEGPATLPGGGSYEEGKSYRGLRYYPTGEVSFSQEHEVRTVLESNRLINVDPPLEITKGENPYATRTTETYQTTERQYDLYWTGFWMIEKADPPDGWIAIEIVHGFSVEGAGRFGSYRHGALDITKKTPPWLNPDPTQAKRFYGDNNDPWHANWGGGSTITGYLNVPNVNYPEGFDSSTPGARQMLADTAKAGNLAIYSHGDTGTYFRNHALYVEFVYPDNRAPSDGGGWHVTEAR